MNIETKTYPDLMTEQELIEYLRIPEVSKATKYKNVISHLKRMRDLPRIHLEILSNVVDEFFLGSVRGMPSDWQINNKEPLGGLF